MVASLPRAHCTMQAMDEHATHLTDPRAVMQLWSVVRCLTESLRGGLHQCRKVSVCSLHPIHQVTLVAEATAPCVLQLGQCGLICIVLTGALPSVQSYNASAVGPKLHPSLHTPSTKLVPRLALPNKAGAACRYYPSSRCCPAAGSPVASHARSCRSPGTPMHGNAAATASWVSSSVRNQPFQTLRALAMRTYVCAL
jgi:hypothetical protein